MTESYPSARTLVCDAEGNCIAEASFYGAYKIFNTEVWNYEKELALLFNSGEIDVAFCQVLTLNEVFCIKGDTLFVLIYEDGWKRYSWNKYLEMKGIGVYD